MYNNKTSNGVNKPKDILDLQLIWYAKLKDSGFKDAESFVRVGKTKHEFFLREYSSNDMNNYSPQKAYHFKILSNFSVQYPLIRQNSQALQAKCTKLDLDQTYKAHKPREIEPKSRMIVLSSIDEKLIELYAEGLSQRKVAKKLNELGLMRLSAKTGKRIPWSLFTVTKTLKCIIPFIYAWNVWHPDGYEYEAPVTPIR
ncbi:MAG: hypothetical protein FMNOHCHN_03784 [Ignavibacteriaceae bacterium]|nr:hypothetical protein [Ignavibacteriaceae bacterium]